MNKYSFVYHTKTASGNVETDIYEIDTINSDEAKLVFFELLVAFNRMYAPTQVAYTTNSQPKVYYND